MKVIQAKLKGRRPALQERETAQSADVIDLMARLRASLEGKQGKKGAATPRAATKKTAKTSKRKPRHAA
jgi:non-homologous end joining protein Ku